MNVELLINFTILGVLSVSLLFTTLIMFKTWKD